MRTVEQWRAVGFVVVLLVASVTWAHSRSRPSSAPQVENQEESEPAPGVNPKNAKPDQKNGKKKNKKAARKELTKETETLPAVLMEEPGDPESLNLYYGAGGKQDEPTDDQKYVFVAEDMSQTQPKFDVKDSAGRRWRVKMGPEYRPETAASRLVWAAGYYTDEEYNLEELSVEGLPRLRRGRHFEHGSTVQGVRLKLQPKNEKTIGNWKWFDNPFTGTRELNGLRVVMALLNNWDLITPNNKIYDVDGQRRVCCE